MTTTVPTPAWVHDLLGAEAVVVDVFGGGTSRDTLLVQRPGHEGRLVARHDAGTGPLSGTGFTLAREAAAFRFAAGAGVPVPGVVAVADDGTALAVDEVPGTPEAAVAALDGYLGALGRLHAAPLDDLPDNVDGFDRSGAEDLAMWRRAAQENLPAPVSTLEIAFDVLRRQGAGAPSDVVFCHGDAGPGNYLHDGATVTGLIDWEMAHTGDPHDDLASVAVRATLAGVDLGDYADRIRRWWAPTAGRDPDPDRYRRSVLSVLTRMVVSCRLALAHPSPTTDRTVQLMGCPLMEVHLLRTAAAIDGVRLPSPPDDPPADRAMLADIATVLVESLDGEGSEDDSGRGRCRRLRYLAAQLRDAVPFAGPAPTPSTDPLHAAWDAANRRLAALPASRPLAAADIPGVK